MTIETKIREIVNPNGRDVAVYYPGSAYDILTPLHATDASRFIFVDMVDPAYGTKERQIVRIESAIKKAGGNIKHIRDKNDITRIEFRYSGRKRNLTYYFYRDAETFVPRKLCYGYDIYFSKYAGPFNNAGYLATRIHLMKEGGFFVTQADLVLHTLIKDKEAVSMPANFDFPALGMEKKAEEGEFSVIQKTRQVCMNHLLDALAPECFHLLATEIQGWINECTSNPDGLFAKDKKWQESMRNKMGELNMEYRLLPEQHKSEEKQRCLERINLEFSGLKFQQQPINESVVDNNQAIGRQ